MWCGAVLAVSMSRSRAEAEGLPLVRSATNASGFKHVRHDQNCTRRPYLLQFEGRQGEYVAELLRQNAEEEERKRRERD